MELGLFKEELELFGAERVSEPMYEHSKSHSPNMCKMLLHLGRSGAKGRRPSGPKEGREDKLDEDDGPDDGAGDGWMLDGLLLVIPIKVAFGRPSLKCFCSKHSYCGLL